LICDGYAPKAVFAADPSEAQIEHAKRRPIAQRAAFHVADAKALPFADSTFEVVTAALVMNFIPDRLSALAEMRRVLRAGGTVAGYVWDLAAELAPGWPLRLAMRKVGIYLQAQPPQTCRCVEADDPLERAHQAGIGKTNSFARSAAPSSSPPVS
jgi:ubiquinone/menaquinone biosynthesis C-methylase UbiE